jgi:hypothetical protein
MDLIRSIIVVVPVCIQPENSVSRKRDWKPTSLFSCVLSS